MSAPDATQQRLDPIGGLAAWPLAPVTALIVVGYAIFSTITQADEVQIPFLTAAALVAVAAAAGVLVWASLPESAPFRRRSTMVIVGLALLGYLLEQSGMWGHNASVHNDFGQIALGLLLMALAPFRPWREIALVAFGAAVVVAVGAFAQAAFFGDSVFSVIYAILAAVQLLAPALAGAAYCRHVVKSIRVWQTDAQRSIRLTTEHSRAAMAESIVQQRRAGLEATVLPFLDAVLQRGTVTVDDIERAGILADEVRRDLVAETDHTWLDDLMSRESVGTAGASTAGKASIGLPGVIDVERRAARFTDRQRAALGALLVLLVRDPRREPGSLTVALTGATTEERKGGEPHGDVTVVALEASVALGDRQLRALVHPFVAVLRVEFTRVRVAVTGQRLSVHVESPSGRTWPTVTAASSRNEY